MYLLKGEQSERLTFKEVSINNFNEWLDFYQDPNTSLYWIMEKEEPLLSCQNFYKKQQYRYENNLGGLNALFEKSTNRFIGHCGLLVQTVDGVQELEIGYSLLPEFWNKGYAIEAAKKCRDHAFENNLTDNLISIISLTNKPSEKVAIKNGMKVSQSTIYNKNKVNIFRITKSEWEGL